MDIAPNLHTRTDGLDAAYLAAIVESSDDGIIGKDLSGIIRSWNHGAEAIFGYRANEAIGRPVRILFPPDRLDEEDHIVERILRGERVDHYETIRRRKNGTDFPVSLTISPIRDASGAIVGASKIVRDITERHRAQTELLQARDDLERMVQERTKALAERDLLLREVYHRVKNNLQIVDGLMMIQALKIEDPQAQEAVMGLRTRVQALGLVHQQLMRSADLKTFDVAPFLHELIGNVIGGAAHEGISLTVDATPLPVGLDFAVPVGMVVTELVTNALKHAFPDRIGAVSVRLRLQGKGRVELTVRDNGVGEGPDEAGPGLGSRIVKRLVAQVGGEMAVQYGDGTTVEITIPLPEAS